MWVAPTSSQSRKIFGEHRKSDRKLKAVEGVGFFNRFNVPYKSLNPKVFLYSWKAGLLFQFAMQSIELEVVLGIVVRYVLYHAAEHLLIVGQQALFNVVAKDVAEQTAEVLMTRIAQERARVCEHTHETAQQAKY